MKGQEVLKVVEGGGEVRLQGGTLGGEEVGHITRHSTAAWQSAGSTLVCPVPTKPT